MILLVAMIWSLRLAYLDGYASPEYLLAMGWLIQKIYIKSKSEIEKRKPNLEED